MNLKNKKAGKCCNTKPAYDLTRCCNTHYVTKNYTNL